MTTNTIIYQDAGSERLDVFLTKNSDYTRNFFHRLVARGDISVNDKIVTKKSLGLKTGDSITIVHPERYMEASRLADSPKLHLTIVIEKDDYLVVYKPKGVLSHPNSVRGVEHANMVGALYHYFQDRNLPSTGNFVRAGLIHRLDKETDGLMLIVKTEEGLKYFKDLFQRKSLAETIPDKEAVPLKKFYRAQVLLTEQGKKFLTGQSLPITIQELVKPKVPHYEPKMGITKILSWGGVKGNEATWQSSPGGKECNVQNLDRFVSRDDEQFINLELEILTGRTHQIRYHLSSYGLPVRGDYLYMDKSQYNEQDDLSLTAYRLQFLDIEGEMIDVQCERSW